MNYTTKTKTYNFSRYTALWIVNDVIIKEVTAHCTSMYGLLKSKTFQSVIPFDRKGRADVFKNGEYDFSVFYKKGTNQRRIKYIPFKINQLEARKALLQCKE